MALPMIIQGGMGVAVSNWVLARAVAQMGQMGVVSGTSLNNVMIRRLQLGDEGGHVRRALKALPFPAIAERIVRDYFVEGGIGPKATFKRSGLFGLRVAPYTHQVMAAAAFVEVHLAKEGHSGVVGINLLEKLQLMNLPVLYGAMLADVDYILMGAGIPREIPGTLDLLSQQKEAKLRVQTVGSSSAEGVFATFDPQSIFQGEKLSPLRRPSFLGIISSATLAQHLAKKSNGTIQGFVIEGPTAGGHNAPPRGPLRLNEQGEPIYGEKDVPDLKAIQALGYPFWLAGGYGSPEKLQWALDQGAVGIQVGTAFAFCNESGIDPEIRRRVLSTWVFNDSREKVFTDAVASPTDFPFKVLPLDQSLARKDVYDKRPRKCDLGYLRVVVPQSDGSSVLRCSAEPVDDYLKKGGSLTEAQGRKCL